MSIIREEGETKPPSEPAEGAVSSRTGINKPSVAEQGKPPEKPKNPTIPIPMGAMIAGICFFVFGLDWAVSYSTYLIAGLTMAGIGIVFLISGASQLKFVQGWMAKKNLG